jgi:Fe/S biogenesis protein NfuA
MSGVVTITEPARAQIRDLLSTESDADALAVRLEVNGFDNGAYSYELSFQDLGAVTPEDTIETYADFAVVIPQASVDKLRGATVELSGERMVVRNPNRPPPSLALEAMGGQTADLSGDLAQRIVRVLDEQINPAIAAHGGRADLVAVEEPIAYLRLSGGCQGCGIAGVTIKEGIEVMILDAVHEITEVVDVTDHASGANPFYESAEHEKG